VSFTPTQDVTLRQAIIASGVVSTDGDLDVNALSVDQDSVQPKFQLSSLFGFPFTDLAFPVPAGRPVFFSASGQSQCYLVFS